MKLGRAITYIFEDKNWLVKIIPLLLVGALSAIPILGLLATAIGLGYLLHLAKNVRDGYPRPLPPWDDWQAKLQEGLVLLIAVIVYNLPAVVITVFASIIISGVGSSLFGSSVTFFVFCCTMPLVLLYTVIAWCLLAVGVTEFMDTGNWRRLYRILHLWDVLTANNNIVFQWALYAFFVNVGLGVIGAIPCIGWLVVLLFGYPIHGHLFGQFAHRLSVARHGGQKRIA